MRLHNSLYCQLLFLCSYFYVSLSMSSPTNTPTTIERRRRMFEACWNSKLNVVFTTTKPNDRAQSLFRKRLQHNPLRGNLDILCTRRVRQFGEILCMFVALERCVYHGTFLLSSRLNLINSITMLLLQQVSSCCTKTSRTCLDGQIFQRHVNATQNEHLAPFEIYVNESLLLMLLRTILKRIKT